MSCKCVNRNRVTRSKRALDYQPQLVVPVFSLVDETLLNAS
jgi:hypothetical protein